MRDLDERIARKVFGCEWRRSSVTGRRCLYGPGGPISFWMQDRADGTEELVSDCPDGMVGVPHYSTNMTDTWRVVDYLARRGYWLLLSTPVNPGSPCQAEFAPHGEVRCGSSEYTGHGDTAAEAICRAALAVMNGTTSEGTP